MLTILEMVDGNPIYTGLFVSNMKEAIKAVDLLKGKNREFSIVDIRLLVEVYAKKVGNVEHVEHHFSEWASYCTHKECFATRHNQDKPCPTPFDPNNDLPF